MNLLPATVVVSVLLSSAALAAPSSAGAPGWEAEVQALSADIALLEQLNPLQLSQQQIDSLLGLTQRWQSIIQTFAPKREELLKALASSLRQKRQLLLRDQPTPDELEDKIAKLNTELAALDRAAREQGSKLAADLQKLLKPAQLAVLTGQYQARDQALQLLDWVRGLKDDEYQEEAAATAEDLETPEKGLTAGKIRQLLDQARAMDDATFAAQGPALAEQLVPAYELSDAAKTQILVDLLSNPRLPALLQDKKAASAR